MSQLPGTAIIGMEQYPTANGHNGHDPAINGSGPVIDHTDTAALTESVPSEGRG
jgi:hypothetical protein